MRMNKWTIALPIVLTAALFSGIRLHGAIKIDSSVFGAIEARSIGPAVMGGRIMAIDAVSSDPRVIYVGTATGGVWKSTNAGTTFKPIFDKHTMSIGAIAIDQSHPETIWVGTGESCTRNSASVGTGLYKSSDAGETWLRVGLEQSERISRIVVHPNNSDTVYVAVPGHLWDDSEERGVYQTKDGGKTWKRILYMGPNIGGSDLAIDSQDPNIVYAALWQFRRQAYFFSSGGAGSGLHKSTDGGKTWKKLARGLPEGPLGRIAIAVAASRPSVIYANVESKKTALFRSDDLGENWTEVNSSFNVKARPFYFSHLVVDPKDYNRVYKPGYSLSVSHDGGRSFTSPFSGEGGRVHSDAHALWIHPHNPMEMLLGTDGGIYVSHDQGNTWMYLNNLPVSQFYHVAFDLEDPYRVYGGLQDNGSWVGPSQSPNGITNKDWRNVGFGDGFYVFPDPTDKDIIYAESQGGRLIRHHKSTRETKEIRPFPSAGEPKLRFNWNTPIAFSPSNPRVMYVGGQFLFRSSDKGESWERISGDLTTDDPEKQKQEESGGLTTDNSTAENHCTIFTISESLRDEKVIWVGTDDGNLQVTRDGGKTWTNVIKNISGLPANTWCTGVEAGRQDLATAYAVFDGHHTGDMKVYVFKTMDFGKTWKSLATETLSGYAHVIRQDPVNSELLFLGTEFGLFLSVDGGEQWAQFTGKLPNVAIRDLVIHPRASDMILATHGRGLMIIDDITPLRQITSKVLEATAYILEARPSRIIIPAGAQEFPGDAEYVGPNPSETATITYYLKDRHIFGDLKLEIYDTESKLIATLPGGKRRGINRVSWQMRLKPPKVPPAPTLAARALFGPMAPEGTYTVKLLKGSETYTGSLRLIADPRLPHSTEDRTVQREAVMKLYRMQERLAFIAAAVTDARDQARNRKLPSGDKLASTLAAFAGKLDALRKTLAASKEGTAITGEEQLREHVVDLYGAISNYGGRPTRSQLSRLASLEQEIEKSNGAFEAIIGKELDGINTSLKGKKLEPIKILSREEFDKKQEAL
ncbi:MAG: glycosyl hydrolase [Acidobacteria bacterium]|nr:glycosyl hydrolase [Acidobacteriota bacterium]